jgi:hypothetical protein
MAWIIVNYEPHFHFIDLGTANQPDTDQLNKGLADWKQRLGGRIFLHDFYVWGI